MKMTESLLQVKTWVNLAIKERRHKRAHTYRMVSCIQSFKAGSNKLFWWENYEERQGNGYHKTQDRGYFLEGGVRIRGAQSGLLGSW